MHYFVSPLFWGAGARCNEKGDTYQEQGVVVVDKNEDESERTVKIEYSEPFGEKNNAGTFSPLPLGDYSIVRVVL